MSEVAYKFNGEAAEALRFIDKKYRSKGSVTTSDVAHHLSDERALHPTTSILDYLRSEECIIIENGKITMTEIGITKSDLLRKDRLESPEET